MANERHHTKQRMMLLLLATHVTAYFVGRVSPRYPNIRELTVERTERVLRDWALEEKNPQRQRALLHGVSTLSMLTSKPSVSSDHALLGPPVCVGVCDPYISAVMVVVPHRNESAVQLWIIANHPLRPSAGRSLMNILVRSVTDVHKQHTVAPRWWITPP